MPLGERPSRTGREREQQLRLASLSGDGSPSSASLSLGRREAGEAGFPEKPGLPGRVPREGCHLSAASAVAVSVDTGARLSGSVNPAPAPVPCVALGHQVLTSQAKAGTPLLEFTLEIRNPKILGSSCPSLSGQESSSGLQRAHTGANTHVHPHRCAQWH